MPSRLLPIFCPYGDAGVVAYAVITDRVTLIDTGGPQHPRAEIAAALQERGWTLDAVAAIVNTHGHWDHGGGNNAVAEATGGRVEVSIHEAGAWLLTDAAPHLDGYYGETARLLERADLLRALRLSVHSQFEPGPAPTRRFGDGDRIDLGDGVVFDVLHVPGHSDDHCALYWEREGILIAGDAVQGTGSRAGGCPLYFGNVAQARKSVHRLLEVPFRTLHISHPFGRPGHDKRPTVRQGEDARGFLTDSLAVLDAMEEALAETYREQPADPYPEILRRAVARLELAGRWPLRQDQATGVPWGAAVTFHRLGRHLGYW